MSDTMAVTHAPTRLSRPLVLLFALACGISVANLYYAQPVLDNIAKSFGTSSGTAGLVVTFAQIGYAIGLAFLVPLGDLLARRGLVPAVLAVTPGGLGGRPGHRGADRCRADRRRRVGRGTAPCPHGCIPG